VTLPSPDVAPSSAPALMRTLTFVSLQQCARAPGGGSECRAPPSGKWFQGRVDIIFPCISMLMWDQGKLIPPL
jgi:hypothetical protein